MQNNFRPVGFSILPPVVKNLLIINGLSFLIGLVMQERFGLSLNRQLGLFYPESEYFKPYQLITHIFMHGDFWHLFFNMFSLWMFGSVLENYWGAKRFFIYYFATGLGAAAIHLGFNAYEVFEIKQAINSYLANPSYATFYDLHGVGSRILDW
ncbi:MAG: rhomboid family intramembrane serine protease, partial [Bacteroidetes bacterium]